MRCLRLALPQAANIRVNAICPFFTATNMTAEVAEQWRKHNLPVNEPTGVAEIIVGIASHKGMNGKAIYIEGNRGWDVEENIDKLSPQWMGEQQTKDFYRGTGIIQSVRLGICVAHSILTLGQGGWGQI
jgi:short-subunit dehydrogenase